MHQPGIPYAKKAGDTKRLTLAYINRADVLTNTSSYSAALKDCDTAIQYAEKMAGNSDALGRIYGIIAGIYTAQEQYGPAEVNIDKSLQYFLRTTNRRMVAQMLSDKADLYNILEQPAKAVPLLKEAIRIGDSLDDKENLAAYRRLQESYARMNQFDESRKSAMRAINICETGNELGGKYLLQFVRCGAENKTTSVINMEKKLPGLCLHTTLYGNRWSPPAWQNLTR